MIRTAPLLCTILTFTISVFSEECSSICPEIVCKAEWEGRPAIKVDYSLIPVEYVVVHHSSTHMCMTPNVCSQQLRNLQAYDMIERQFWDIGYNFLVSGDGRIYEGAGWHKKSGYDYNSSSLVLGLSGNFIYDKPTNEQLQAVKDFLNCAVKTFELDVNYKLIGGSQILDTQSPGLNIFNEIKTWRHFAIKP